MSKPTKELLNARREANQAEAERQKLAEAPPVDNQVRVVTYIDRKGEKRVQYCQEFKSTTNDANACGIMWMGDHVENQPGHREIIGQTFGILEWSVEKLDMTWEEFLKKE